MNIRACQALRQKLSKGETTFGLWISLEAPSITEMAVALGLDWVVIDAEHGALDWQEIIGHLRATVRSETAAFIRVVERDTGHIKRALDIGADGVILPWMESAEQIREAVKDCRYPPEGRRGIGGERATAWGQCFAEHTAAANENVFVIPLIESVRAMPNLAEMCAVEGTEIFLIGPADFSSSAGYRGQWEGPGVAEQVLAIKDAVRKAGKHCGVMATNLDDLKKRQEQGFQVIGLGSDAGLMFKTLRQSLAAVGRDRQPSMSFDPKEGQPR
jgi:2-keto-3-deoxy-L-rhamnonate aldolase RhmA